MPDIMHTLKIKTSPDQVYRAIATAEGIRDWWTRDAAFDPKGVLSENSIQPGFAS